MFSSLSSCLVPFLLAAGLVTMIYNSLQAKDVNKSLIHENVRAKADAQFASEKLQDCNIQLKTKTADVTTKEKDLEDLKSKMTTLTEEKVKLMEEFDKLKSQLEKTKTAKDILLEEKNKLSVELAAVNNSEEKQPKTGSEGKQENKQEES